jgi:hypothetical protein
MYDVIRDFASPVVTLIAATIAGLITLTFARVQALIAKSQRDIALDKLKFDLFDKRYEIYLAAKELLEYVPFITDLQKSDTTKIRSLYVKIDEARFYFPPEICAVLSDIHDRCELFFLHLTMRDQTSIDDHAQWTQIAETLAADQSMLRAIYAALPETFEPALAFKQLTTASTSDPLPT